jgi:hypothetical protein
MSRYQTEHLPSACTLRLLALGKWKTCPSQSLPLAVWNEKTVSSITRRLCGSDTFCKAQWQIPLQRRGGWEGLLRVDRKSCTFASLRAPRLKRSFLLRLQAWFAWPRAYKRLYLMHTYLPPGTACGSPSMSGEFVLRRERCL